MGFPTQGYWSRLPFPFSRDWIHVYCLAGEFFTTEPLGKPKEGISMISKWASLVAQLVNNLPVMQETWVWFLGWEDLLEKEMATHSSTLGWRISWKEDPGGATVHGVTKSWTWLSDIRIPRSTWGSTLGKSSEVAVFIFGTPSSSEDVPSCLTELSTERCVQLGCD